MARCDASERSEASHAIGRPSREARRRGGEFEGRSRSKNRDPDTTHANPADVAHPVGRWACRAGRLAERARGGLAAHQDWPVSVEAQFLAGGRTTMNVCTPGTEIFMKGAMVKAHCTNSSSRTYANDEWVAVEVEVPGADRCTHRNGPRLVSRRQRTVTSI